MKFYTDIQQIVKESNKQRFIDVFAGCLGVSLNIKQEFPEMEVYANAKDKDIEHLVQGREKLIETYEQVVKEIYGDLPMKPSNEYYADKDTWTKLKEGFFQYIGRSICPCCGKPIKGKKELGSVEKAILSMITIGGSKQSLAHSFYSPQKQNNLQRYVDALDTLTQISHLPFTEIQAPLENAVIFLDPPYIQSIKTHKHKFVGYNYATKCDEWTTEEDEQLIQWIQQHQGKNNTFILFGSKNNHLYQQMMKHFALKQYKEYQYRGNSFGHVSEKFEWMAVI